MTEALPQINSLRARPHRGDRGKRKPSSRSSQYVTILVVQGYTAYVTRTLSVQFEVGNVRLGTMYTSR